MTLLRDVVVELIGMFAGDAWSTTAILAVVAITALLIEFGGIDPLIGGGVLLVGCLLALVGAVRHASLRPAAPVPPEPPEAC